MAVDDRHDLARILGSGIVRRIKDEVLRRRGGDVAAREVPTPTFDHDDQPAALAGIFGLRVREDFSFEAVA